MSRLYNYGFGIHLLQSEDPENMPKISQINPKDNHISFQVRLSLSFSFSLFVSREMPRKLQTLFNPFHCRFLRPNCKMKNLYMAV